jgi:hypothetical protein
MASKLTLKANPTFTAEVKIPVPGGAPEAVKVTFKHKTQKQLEEFSTGEGAKDRKDDQTVLEIASGWDIEAPFTADSLNEFFQNYHGAAKAIVTTYMAELTQVRLGN